MVMSGYLINTYVLLTNREVKKFAFLTKPKVKMAGYIYIYIQPSYRACVVKKWFIIPQKDFALLRIKKELFISRAGKESCVCSTINPRELFMLSFYYFFLHLNSVIDSASFHSSYKLSYCQTPQLESLRGMINNSLLKLELLTNGEAVISHEFRESLGCSKTDATNTKNVLAANSVYISY